MTDFQLTTATQEPGLATAMEVVYQWDYAPQVDELRRLYVKATEAQWLAERDLDWERDIDEERFATTPLGFALPIEETTYWKGLPKETRFALTKRTAVLRLSNFLHGEQGALMVAAQLVNAVPHTDAKFYAATQTMDEARHVDVFARYVTKLDEVQPIAEPLKRVLDTTLATGNWLHKLVGMQIVVEGLALYSFKEMRALSQEPLLKELLGYVARDESRHHAYGVQYVARCVPLLSDAERADIEDFALDAAQTLVDNRRQTALFGTMLASWQALGVDAAEMFTSMRAEREALAERLAPGRRLGPVQGFVIPTLRRCGLLSERVAARYHEFLQANIGAKVVGETVEEFLRHLPDLPEDTAAWVAGELQ
jgi:hypothetical protein